MATDATSTASKTEPVRNPSYPQRVHIQERAKWQAVLKEWEDKIAAAKAGFEATGKGSAFLLHQMAGARDQIAVMAGRLPMEVGHVYEEDKHLLEQAVQSLERLFKKWEG